MSAYPVYLTSLEEQEAVVVGNGPSVVRKVEGLLEAGAQVTLIAPNPSTNILKLAEADAVDWRARAYEGGDLERAALVIVTDASEEAKARIAEEARKRNVLLNITGDDECSTFANGAVLRRGPLVVSVSTSGAAPAAAVRIRENLAEELGPEYEELLTIMNALRDPMQTHVSDFAERRDRWYAILDSDALNLLQDDRREAALDRIESIVGPDVMESMDVCM
jgi:siroheme synthase-like protein